MGLILDQQFGKQFEKKKKDMPVSMNDVAKMVIFWTTPSSAFYWKFYYSHL